jgi:hypothetical protein
MRRFVRTLRQDIEAVRNAVLEPWSNGQTEGQINKLKTLKLAICSSSPYMDAPALTCFALACCRWRDVICNKIEAEPSFWQRDNGVPQSKHVIIFDKKKRQYLIVTRADGLLAEFVSVGAAPVEPGVGANLAW